MTRQEKSALAAVAHYFSATWHDGPGPPDAYLCIDGKRIAVEVVTLRVGRGVVGRPRLRFDRVVLGLMRRLRAALTDFVPEGRAVVLTVTAPIRLASKTAAALEEKIRMLLARRAAQPRLTDTIHGNQVRVAIMKSGSSGAAKVIGFVHNADSDPAILFELTNSMLACLGPEVATRPGKSKRERWLVITNDGGFAHIETYRQVYAQLALPSEFQRILLVLGGSRVEVLAELQ